MFVPFNRHFSFRARLISYYRTNMKSFIVRRTFIILHAREILSIEHFLVSFAMFTNCYSAKVRLKSNAIVLKYEKQICTQPFQFDSRTVLANLLELQLQLAVSPSPNSDIRTT